jgi:hypothetical protein
VANFYFLVIVVIELIPRLSPLSPLASLMPLLIVLGATLLKDLYEDFVCNDGCDARISFFQIHFIAIYSFCFCVTILTPCL